MTAYKDVENGIVSIATLKDKTLAAAFTPPGIDAAELESRRFSDTDMDTIGRAFEWADRTRAIDDAPISGLILER